LQTFPRGDGPRGPRYEVRKDTGTQVPTYFIRIALDKGDAGSGAIHPRPERRGFPRKWMNIGDEVVFKSEVIRRCNHSRFASSFCGVVVDLDERVCGVEMDDRVWYVPVENVVSIGKVKDRILDLP